jgi:hypothetical protein
MSYKNLEIWQLARNLVIDIHRMTLNELPKFEMYEEGSQIRKSIKSVKSTIVEGYGRRRYKKDYLRIYDDHHVHIVNYKFDLMLQQRLCRAMNIDYFQYKIQ